MYIITRCSTTDSTLRITTVYFGRNHEECVSSALRYCGGDIVTSLSGAVLIAESDCSGLSRGLMCLDPHQAENSVALGDAVGGGAGNGASPHEPMGQGQGHAALWRVESCDLCVKWDWLCFSLPCDTALDMPQNAV